MNMTKTALTIAIAAAMTVPSVASAANKKKTTHAATSYTNARQVESRVEHDLDSKVAKLEAEIQQLRGQIAATRTEAKSNLNAVVAQTQAKEAAQDAEIAKDEEPHNRLFFRGNYAALTHNVSYNGSADGAVNAVAGNPAPNVTANGAGAGVGWGVGVGVEHGLTQNLFGLTDALSLNGELAINYMHYGTLYNNVVVGKTTTGIGTNPSIDQLQITASPKLRVNNLGGFSPWVIPVGLAIGVSGLPSSAITVLSPGLLLGAGLDYDFTKNLFAGFDFRYQFFGNNLNQQTTAAQNAGIKGISLDGFQTGVNLGFKF
ncbi:hypothetical protein F6R98_17830 [Candidatus Methylospira mobilis]|uniref:Porin family protein n=1 Tax=Candidatus Methylospira mobilis TaxID=1808979 RepID=A0A5Q0BPY7_9GAMM|nr:hypothetical protein [Candidatus Methylospira mobilis]QFY44264.1 hypothetical protein F6R98_17830 [Candidatus Methylospira mobilis]WNV06310.1 hypothetical protein RP726_07865 [Candidatus Methylospira mobilis]